MVLLVEYSPNDIEELSKQAVDELQALNPEWQQALDLRKEPFRIDREGSSTTVVPQGVCGQLEVGNQTVEVVPKYLANRDDVPADWRENFLTILAFSGVSEFHIEFAETIHGGASASSLMDIMAAAYADRLSTALAQGVPADYTEREERLSNARGRLSTRKLYPQLLKKPSELWYRTTVYTTDIPLSRILKWACHRFSELATATQTVNRLYELEQRFPNIEPADVSGLRPSQVSLSSQHRRFDESLTIAKWLLDNLEAAYAGEDVALPGILFKTEEMYEGFVDAVLDAVDVPWEYTGKDAETYKRLASGQPHQNINPDHLFRSDEACILVLDSKYTKMGSGTDVHGDKPERNYFYQVLAYGRGYEADAVGLVYPRLRTQKRCWELETAGTPSTVHVFEIDPMKFLADQDAFFQSVQKRLVRVVA
ncbi:McrC family protein [Halorussus lipolyticus]|uniref:McrC family protein n=1 Tax=Halorussus lipolyticus TaxID=3034024 RepID=UPI0023E7648D|nr:hypothetical protein [Halorussus sp. DT80]